MKCFLVAFSPLPSAQIAVKNSSVGELVSWRRQPYRDNMPGQMGDGEFGATLQTRRQRRVLLSQSAREAGAPVNEGIQSSGVIRW